MVCCIRCISREDKLIWGWCKERVGVIVKFLDILIIARISLWSICRNSFLKLICLYSRFINVELDAVLLVSTSSVNLANPVCSVCVVDEMIW